MIFWLTISCVLTLVLSFGAARYRSHIYSQRHPPIGNLMPVDGVTLHYHDTAGAHRAALTDSSPLVFIHGASSNLRDAVLAFEKPLGGKRRLIFVDRPGHGHSTRHSALQSDPRRQADLIAKLLARLEVDNAIIVGHSWGGAVAAAMGLQHGEMLKGLVFLAPATHPWPGGVLWYYKAAHLPIVGRVFAWCVATFVGAPRVNCAAAAVFAPDRMPADYPEIVGAELALRPAQFLANAADIVELHQHVDAMSKDYSTITTSALVITGTQDDVVCPHLHAHGLMRDLPDAKLIEFQNCGHMPHHSRNKETVVAIEAFADGLTG